MVDAQRGMGSFSIIFVLLYITCLPIIHVTCKESTVLSESSGKNALQVVGQKFKKRS